MRSQLSKHEFFRRMKKKPALQQVLDNLLNITVSEIEHLRGSQFPLWVREELLELKKRNGKTAMDVASEIAAQMIKASTKD